MKILINLLTCLIVVKNSDIINLSNMNERKLQNSECTDSLIKQFVKGYVIALNVTLLKILVLHVFGTMENALLIIVTINCI